MRHLLTSTAILLWAGAAMAQDAALLLGTERYETLGRLSRGTEILGAAEPLRRGAMQVRFRVRVMRLATHTHTRICADACAVAPRSAWRRAAAWR